MVTNEEILRLVLQAYGEEDAKALEQQLEHTEKAKDRAGKSTARFGKTAPQSDRIVQDLAQGGLGDILNNIKGVTTALGLGTGLAGVLTIVGVAAATAGPKLIDFARLMADGSNAIPATVDLAKQFEIEPEGVNDEPGNLAEKHCLTNTELTWFKELTQQIDVENLLAQERVPRQVRQTPGADQQGRAKQVDDIIDQMDGLDTLKIDDPNRTRNEIERSSLAELRRGLKYAEVERDAQAAARDADQRRIRAAASDVVVEHLGLQAQTSASQLQYQEANPIQEKSTVQFEIAQRLRQIMPQIDARQHQGVVFDATNKVEKQIDQRLIVLGDQQIQQQDTLIAVNQQLSAQLDRLRQKCDGQGKQIASLWQKVNARTQDQRNRGRGG
jgi:hypothetical protein